MIGSRSRISLSIDGAGVQLVPSEWNRNRWEESMTYDYIRVTPLATFVGAEISGVDLATSPGEVQVAEVRRALGITGSCSSATSS